MYVGGHCMQVSVECMGKPDWWYGVCTFLGLPSDVSRDYHHSDFKEC